MRVIASPICRRMAHSWEEKMIPDLLRFIEIDRDTVDRGPEIWRLLEPHADAIVQAFYSRVRTFSTGSDITDSVLGRLKIKQKQHWAALFVSQFDDEYANSVRRIGIEHRDINLDPMWYVAAYMVLKIAFSETLTNAALPPIKKSKLLKALDKYVALDMALALSAYGAVVFD